MNKTQHHQENQDEQGFDVPSDKNLKAIFLVFLPDRHTELRPLFPKEGQLWQLFLKM